MIRFAGLAGISAAILAYQILLTRLFAIVQWHHFAFMAISIALLGFGLSGALLAIWRRAVEWHLERLFSLCATGFAVTSPLAFFLAQRVPFNALELVWDPAQLLNLAAIYLALVVPFAFGAACIGLAFLRRDPAGRVYFWNLLGSGAGALAVVGTISTLSPVANLAAVSLLGLTVAAFGLAAERKTYSKAAGIGMVLAGALIWLLIPQDWTALRIAEHKGLAVARSVLGAKVVEQRFGPLGLVSVVESPAVPFRSAPGLSLTASALPPEQIALFTDADGATMIDRDAGRSPPAYLRDTTDALVYALVPQPKVLVLSAGGGRPVAQALIHGARRVDAVEPNPDLAALLHGGYADFSGGLYERPEVALHLATERGFLAASARRWDVIIARGGGSGTGAGLQGLSETYPLTVEALALMLQRLKAGGWLSFSQALRLPPRAAPKLILTALAALERLAVADPPAHLILIRGIGTTTLLVGRDPASPEALAAATAFAEARSFDLAFHPGLTREAANRFNVLAEPAFYDAALALTGPQRDAFVAGYKFDIAPASDDRPYFEDFFRWRSLPELLAMRTAGGAALLELGELVLVGALLQALVISLVLILLPLSLGGLARGRGSLAWRTSAYFLAIGLAFFFVEIAFIQKFILFLGHPTYALAVVLAGFLVFAGLGAGASEHLARFLSRNCRIRRPTAAIQVAVLGLGVVALLYLIAAPLVFAACAGLPTAGRAIVSLGLIAPLAFFMGMPFPLGLTLVERADRALVPWAWGVNGCASVTSAILAVLLAMQFGYTAVLVIALVLYGLATRALRGREFAKMS